MSEETTSKKILSRDEVLALLSAKALEGSTSAMIALERALRLSQDGPELDDELDRILYGPDVD